MIAFNERTCEFEEVSSSYKNRKHTTQRRGAIASNVKSIIVDIIGGDLSELNEYASFEHDLGADSLDAIELIMEFEEEFQMTIPDEVAERIRTCR